MPTRSVSPVAPATRQAPLWTTRPTVPSELPATPARVLDTLIRWWVEHGEFPTYYDLGAAVGLHQSYVYQIVSDLVRWGYCTREKRVLGWRVRAVQHVLRELSDNPERIWSERGTVLLRFASVVQPRDRVARAEQRNS
jgi:hypothetical protein